MAGDVNINGEEISYVEALGTLQNKFLNSINCFLEIFKQSMGMLYNLDNALESLNKLKKNIVEIEQINHKTKYLALNAAIEAARDENTNKSFQAIASEIRELSNNSNNITIIIHQQLSAINDTLNKTQAILKNIAQVDNSEHILAKEYLDQIVQGILQNHQQSKAGTFIKNTLNLEKTSYDL